jgi:plastocyanin domain-containing protein
MKRILAVLILSITLLGLHHSTATAAKAKGEQTVRLTVTSNGFEPATVHLKAGRPVRLVVTRTVERTCVTDIVVSDFGIKKSLPLNQPVEVRFTPRKAGTIRYACAMDMVAGNLIVE